MTLEEAIQHCKQKAEELRQKAITDYESNETTLAEFADCRECAAEHQQLANWLEELKDFRDGRATCEFCKHNFRQENERPCSLCKHNFVDKFERKDTGETTHA